MKQIREYIAPQIKWIVLKDEIMVIDGSGLDVNPGTGDDEDPNAAKEFDIWGYQPHSVWED